MLRVGTSKPGESFFIPEKRNIRRAKFTVYTHWRPICQHIYHFHWPWKWMHRQLSHCFQTAGLCCPYSHWNPKRIPCESMSSQGCPANSAQWILCWFKAVWCIRTMFLWHFKCSLLGSKDKPAADHTSTELLSMLQQSECTNNLQLSYFLYLDSIMLWDLHLPAPYVFGPLSMYRHRLKRNKVHAPAMGTVKLPSIVCIGTMGLADIFASWCMKYLGLSLNWKFMMD